MSAAHDDLMSTARDLAAAFRERGDHAELTLIRKLERSGRLEALAEGGEREDEASVPHLGLWTDVA